MEIKIQGDERCRIGGDWPLCADVFKKGGDEVYGFNFYPTQECLIEIRRKDSVYSLFMRRSCEEDLPDWWKDSKVIWASKDGL